MEPNCLSYICGFFRPVVAYFVPLKIIIRAIIIYQNICAVPQFPLGLLLSRLRGVSVHFFDIFYLRFEVNCT